MMKFLGRACAAAMLCAVTGAFAAEGPAKIGETARGATLVDAHDKTLYVFDKDMSGKSVCNGACAANWPPLLAADGSTAAGDYSVFLRDDGKSQWAYKGRPLYGWKNDAKPGDITGDGLLNNTWHVAKP